MYGVGAPTSFLYTYKQHDIYHFRKLNEKVQEEYPRRPALAPIST